MINRWIACVMALALCLSLCACGGSPAQTAEGERTERAADTPAPTEAPAETPTEAPATETPAPTETPEPVSYPYLDENGYYHYQIRLDGELLPLAHDALLPTADNSCNEILYPFSEILDYFGVAYFWDRETDDFSTVINGVQVSRDCNDEHYMWFTTQTYGYGNGMIPRGIDGVFYTPNYAFEHTIGASLSKIGKGAELDQACVDITTSAPYTWGEGSAVACVMRWDGQQYVGDAVVTDNGGSGSTGGSSGGATSVTCPACGGTGRITCPTCGGSGMSWNNVMVWDPVTGTMKSQTQQTTCWACGGTRYKTCTTCGGSGHIG